MTETSDEPELTGDDSISQLVAEVGERIRAAERETDAMRVRAGYWRTKCSEALEKRWPIFWFGFTLGVFWTLLILAVIAALIW